MICLVSIINQTYLHAFCVMLTSLVYNNKNLNCDYVVLYDGNISDKDKEKIKKIYDKTTFLKINNEFLSYDRLLNRRKEQWLNNNYSVFSRIEMFNLENYKKIIYLDVDLVVDNHIDYLLNECNDFECYAIKHELHNYFNAGVMVINKKTSFKEYKNRCIEIINKYKEVKGNQGMFNECFKTNSSYIPSIYNLTTRHADVSINIKNRKTVIFHYPGVNKPWDEIKFSNWYSQADDLIKNTFVEKWYFYEKIYKEKYGYEF